jgi:hypothetical protein
VQATVVEACLGEVKEAEPKFEICETSKRGEQV